MKINKQPKALMHAVGDSVDTGALQGARRATEDAPVSTRPLSPSIDSEVVAVAKRQRFTNADKRRIVLAAAACTKPGEIGALMRREGVWGETAPNGPLDSTTKNFMSTLDLPTAKIL